MKLISSTLLAFSLSADAFVIHHEGSKLPSSSSSTTTTTSSLKDVGLQWGFDEESGCRTEYFLERPTEYNKNVPQNNDWAYDPWSGVSQTIFVPRHKEVIGEVQQAFASKDILGSTMTVSSSPPAPPAAQQLPPAEPAQPMPVAQKEQPAAAAPAAAQEQEQEQVAPQELPPPAEPAQPMPQYAARQMMN
mmetsp:Transcript_12039/g.28815  ORF Transcript_12039/g.28815 Transcript_12039/m.28815 type:complete len:190 (+) Transcript_12039:63-632(+)|eukprot:CAMPEP_0113630562 /NCGR_PEP_ID=MMETSP0017_2-20120614/15879_1 /TAXON_ID=2856 /ORGANISM="Cylindrotheca closterium" /LENGTH=189 /DNA_ID=CAMNT_0000541031 /DNA_START=48 /DNA_END=617 /DNA_ORIENTATION=+ /assembly_acc=CAM_ASM_000147